MTVLERSRISGKKAVFLLRSGNRSPECPEPYYYVYVAEEAGYGFEDEMKKLFDKIIVGVEQ